VAVLSLVLLGGWLLVLEGEARPSRGRATGSRESKTYSASKKLPRSKTTLPAKTKSSSKTLPPEPAAAPPTPQAHFGEILGSGVVGGWLYRHLYGRPPARAGQGLAGTGLGPLDILLLVLLACLVYRLVRRRRPETAGAEGPPMQTAAPQPGPQSFLEAALQTEVPPEVEEGLRLLKAADPIFKESRFQRHVAELFFRVQTAWTNRDLSPLKWEITEELYRVLQDDAQRLRTEGVINRMEDIDLQSVEITEAWQDEYSDYLTVRLQARLLDYLVSDQTGELVSGSRTEPVKFEEYWTFTRPTGVGGVWKLAAIYQPE